MRQAMQFTVESLLHILLWLVIQDSNIPGTGYCVTQDALKGGFLCR
jgi:hypothetical protein